MQILSYNPSMKQFVTEESFWELFPDASIGIVVAHNMKPTSEVAPEDATAIARVLSEANGKAAQHLESNTISQNEVVAVWRDAYQKFKTKKGARCSIENLLKRVLKGNPDIETAIDECINTGDLWESVLKGEYTYVKYYSSTTKLFSGSC